MQVISILDSVLDDDEGSKSEGLQNSTMELDTGVVMSCAPQCCSLVPTHVMS